MTLAERATTSDGALVARAQEGDLAAYEELVRRHAGRLRAMLVRLLGNPADAEDVSQEALLRGWRAIDSFHGNARFSTWLYRIAVNEAHRLFERRARGGPRTSIDEHGLELPGDPAQEPAPRAEQDEVRAALEQAVRALSLPLRTAIILRDIEGLSPREAAEVVGIGEAAFKSRLHQARTRVRAALGDDLLLD